MDKPRIYRPSVLSGSEVECFKADVYRERTFEEDTRAQVDTRLKALDLAFRVYKDDPHMFTFEDVLRLAALIAEHARSGETVMDGASALSFYGRK